MHQWVRVTVSAALALACLDGQAKVADKCIQSLEARPTRPDASTPRQCPLAIGFNPRQQASSARTQVRGTNEAASSRRVLAVEAATADAEPHDETPALHV